MLAPAAERTLVRNQAPLILERWNTELAAINHPIPCRQPSCLVWKKQ